MSQKPAKRMGPEAKGTPYFKPGASFIAKNTRQFYAVYKTVPDVPEVVSIRARLCLGLNVIDIAEWRPPEGYWIYIFFSTLSLSSNLYGPCGQDEIVIVSFVIDWRVI